jgi:hypothetical protein
VKADQMTPPGGYDLPAGTTVAGYPLEGVVIGFAASDEITELTTGAGKVTIRAPYAFRLTGVRATLTTAPAGVGICVFDLNVDGVSVFGVTKLSIDAGAFQGSQVVANPTVPDGAAISVDFDTHTGGITNRGTGLKWWLYGVRE